MTVAPFALTGLMNAVTSFSLAGLILWKNPRVSLNRSFALFSISAGFWAFNYFLWLSAEEPVSALFYIRLAMTGVMVIPTAFLAFTYCLVGRRGVWIKPVNILLSLFFLAFSFSPSFIEGVEQRLFFPHWPRPGILFHLMFAHFSFNTLYAHFLLWKALRREHGVKAVQIRYVFLGSLVGFVGGSTNYFLWYHIPIPPYLNFLVSVYIFTVAYAIFKYRLMDIQVVIRRTLVFTGLVAFVLGVYSFGLFVTQEFLTVYFGFKWEMAAVISILLIVIGYEPMRGFLIRTTDKYFFQKKYDYQKLLKDASTGISQIESLHHLLRLVTHFITMRVRVKNAAVLMRNPETGEFQLGFRRGYTDGGAPADALTNRSALIRYMICEKEAVDLERIKESLEKRSSGSGNSVFEYNFSEIQKQMEGLRSACCVPSFLGQELRNVLVLGEKKSGDCYTDQDLNVLFTLAQESAIAIENARLYDEALNRSRQLQKINEELKTAQGRLVQALEATEKANKELLNTQAQLIHEQKMATLGRLAASVGHEVNNPLTILSMNVSRAILKYRKDPDLKVAEVLDLFQKMEQNIGRIKAVVNTLTGLLKKSEKGKFEPLSLKLILEETLPLVQFQTYLDNLTGTEVEFDIPSNIPLIRGDLERLQEVFLNLFINAYQAMAGRRNRKIVVSARLEEGEAKSVTVHFTDNGSGMPEEVQKKIFTYGFTTKAPGRGSGMGLYMCKYIIELHGGDIRVKSRLGVGTTFTLTLPLYEEPSQVGMPGTVQRISQ